MDLHEKKQRALIWGAIAVLVIGLGYWFAARPYVAAKSCHSVALDNSGYHEDNWQTWAGNSKAQTDYMFVYGLCMHKEGFNF